MSKFKVLKHKTEEGRFGVMHKYGEETEIWFTYIPYGYASTATKENIMKFLGEEGKKQLEEYDLVDVELKYL